MPAATETQKPNFGHFPAKLLPCLQPFVQWAREDNDDRFIRGNIFLEPAAVGGIHVAAVIGVAMAVIHVPDGFIRRPCVIDVPDDAFDVAKSRGEIAMTFEGDTHFFALPEWTQPGTCYVSDAGIFISPKMRPPQAAEQPASFWPALFQRIASTHVHTVGIDYSMRERAPPDWRAVLQRSAATPAYTDPRPIACSPAVIALFEDVHAGIVAENENPSRFWFRVAGTAEEPQPIIVTIENHPEFVGLVNPQRMAEPHPLPSHFFFPCASEPEVKQ